MSEPKIVDQQPIVMELEPGSYWWCSCGHTGEHPFCDGAHKPLGMKPVKLEITERQMVALCQCKATGNPPFCDGSHDRL